MKRKMIKGAVCVALVLAMAASTVGCTKKPGSAKVDPELAKQGVFSYEEIELGLNSDSYDIVYSGKSGNSAKIVISEYGDAVNKYSMYSVTSDGSVDSSVVLEMPDCSGYLEVYEGYDYDYDDGDAVIYEDAVGEVDSRENVAVQTTGVEVADFADAYDDISIDDGYSYDDYDDYYEEGIYESLYFNGVNVDDEGNLVAVAEYYASGYQDGQYAYCDKYLATKWNNNGEIVWAKDISDILDSDWIYIDNSALLKNGNFIIIVSGSESMVLTFDSNGNLVGKKSANDAKEFQSVASLTALDDGRLFMVYYDMDNDYQTMCAFIDPDEFTVKQKASLPSNIAYGGSVMYKGCDTDIVACTNSGISKFNIGDEEAKEFMNYINSDINSSDLSNIAMMDSEHFIATYYDYENYERHVAVFTYVDPKDIPDKEIINLAVYYIGYDVRGAVIDFNKESDKYRIVVTNYSQYATEDDYTAGYKKMNNDIISGNCPDIVIADEDYVNFASYANKGLLKDFDELFASDNELKDNEYLTNVFDAFGINGKHYVGVYSFNYNTMTGSSNLFGNATSWTISDFKNMQSKFPADSELLSYVTQNDFLSFVMNFDGTEFVNVEEGKCEFDSEDFITLLEYAASLPAEIEYGDDYWMNYENQFRSGKVILNNTYVYETEWYQQSRYEYFDGNTAMVGFPSRTGDSAIITTDGAPIAIFKNGNVDGAWEFARTFFTEDYQDSLEYAIPVLESSFDKWAAKGMERHSYTYGDGEVEYYDNYYYVDDVQYVVPLMTQEEVDALKSAITSCSKRGYSNQEILEIIEEEASACFAGQKSAAEVATVIQSRVQLYINENN